MHLRDIIKRWTATYRGTTVASSDGSTDDPTSASDNNNKDNKRSSCIIRSSSSSSSSPSHSHSRSSAPSPIPNLSPSRSPEPVERLPKSSTFSKKARKASSAPSTRSSTPVKGGYVAINNAGSRNGKFSMETPPLSCCSKEIAEDPFARVCPSPIPFKKRPPISPLSSSQSSTSSSVPIASSPSSYPFTPPNSAHNSLVCSPISFSSSSPISHTSSFSISKLSTSASSSISISSLSNVSGCSTVTYTTLETPSTSPNLAVSFKSSSVSSSSSASGAVDKNKRLPLPPAFSYDVKNKGVQQKNEGEAGTKTDLPFNNRKAAHPYSKFIEHGLDVFTEEPVQVQAQDLAFSNLVHIIPCSTSTFTPPLSPQHKFSKMRSFTAPALSSDSTLHSSSSSSLVSPSFSAITNDKAPTRPIYIKKNKSFIGLPREKQRFDPEAHSTSREARRRKHASAALLFGSSDSGIVLEGAEKKEEEEDWFARGF